MLAVHGEEGIIRKSLEKRPSRKQTSFQIRPSNTTHQTSGNILNFVDSGAAEGTWRVTGSGRLDWRNVRLFRPDEPKREGEGGRRKKKRKNLTRCI